MTAKELYDKIREITKDESELDIYTSPDFQCDQTGGFPTSLCVSWEHEVAWLKLNEFMIGNGQDVSEYEQMCADFGIRDCSDIEDFNSLLKELGEDAYTTAYIPEEDENEGMVIT